MKKGTLLVLLAATAAFTVMLTTRATQKKESIRHVVAFKYKAGATADQIGQVTNAFRDLKTKIPGIVSFEHGTNNSPEEKNRGFTHVYVLTFEDMKARDTYLPHPEHQKFGELLGRLGILEDVFVVDYVPAS